MLEALRLENVGPAADLSVDFKPRMNFFAGDNGLGKSFLLDAAWWALTRTWARGLVIPHPPPSVPQVYYRYGTRTGKTHEHTSSSDRAAEEWPLEKGRHPIPGLVLYAQVDGGFSVWDQARNYWKGEKRDRQAAYLFTPEEGWHGLPLNEQVKYCNGLLTDWTNWQLEDGDAFGKLRRVLCALAPSSAEPLAPGDPRKIAVGDARRYPTIKMAYGQEVPLVHASAGIRRICALAYLLVWAWEEHVEASKLRGDAPASEIIFLVDEIEAHLHPQWQRRIVPALLGVMNALTGEDDVPVQLVTATHSPLVLASTEPHFDEQRDAVWELDLEDGRVQLAQSDWQRRGDVSAWLTSSVFDLGEARSVEAEEAITAALGLLREDSPADGAVEQVDAALAGALSDVDRFWVRWSEYRRSLLRESDD